MVHSLSVKLYSWSDVTAEALTPLFTRRMIHSERMTIARLELKKGTTVPRHSHENEQVSTVDQGVLRFTFDSGDVDVSAGQTLVIPPNEAHSAVALEDCIALDIFSPPREDWITGNDAYLRK